ncbi:MAG: transposase, partial [Alphaproteobacteria bacterium]|nr:transposase [Alphaproteobacteria bacterium]
MTITELTPKSEPAQRFEVFTGAGRRRIWTAEEKARILSETEVPGASVSAVARRHGLTPQQVFTWRRQARQAGETSGEDPMRFAPVVVAADAADGIAANTPVVEIAHVAVAKYADHFPLYRQARIYARQGIDLDRSTLADWVGRAASYLDPPAVGYVYAPDRKGERPAAHLTGFAGILQVDGYAGYL